MSETVTNDTFWVLEETNTYTDVSNSFLTPVEVFGDEAVGCYWVVSFEEWEKMTHDPLTDEPLDNPVNTKADGRLTIDVYVRDNSYPADEDIIQQVSSTGFSSIISINIETTDGDWLGRKYIVGDPYDNYVDAYYDACEAVSRYTKMDSVATAIMYKYYGQED
jgi:hypothetical protein